MNVLLLFYVLVLRLLRGRFLLEQKQRDVIPLSSEHGTYKTVKARQLPALDSGEKLSSPLGCARPALSPRPLSAYE